MPEKKKPSYRLNWAVESSQTLQALPGKCIYTEHHILNEYAKILPEKKIASIHMHLIYFRLIN